MKVDQMETLLSNASLWNDMVGVAPHRYVGELLLKPTYKNYIVEIKMDYIEGAVV